MWKGRRKERRTAHASHAGASPPVVWLFEFLLAFGSLHFKWPNVSPLRCWYLPTSTQLNASTPDPAAAAGPSLTGYHHAVPMHSNNQSTPPQAARALAPAAAAGLECLVPATHGILQLHAVESPLACMLTSRCLRTCSSRCRWHKGLLTVNHPSMHITNQSTPCKHSASGHLPTISHPHAVPMHSTDQSTPQPHMRCLRTCYSRCRWPDVCAAYH